MTITSFSTTALFLFAGILPAQEVIDLTDRDRQLAAEGRPDARDAEAPHPRQHAGPAGRHLDGASAERVLLPRLPDYGLPGRDTSRMIGMRNSGHREGGVAKPPPLFLPTW